MPLMVFCPEDPEDVPATSSSSVCSARFAELDGDVSAASILSLAISSSSSLEVEERLQEFVSLASKSASLLGEAMANSVLFVVFC